MLLPVVGFNLGNPSPNSPPIPGNLGAASEAAELFRMLHPLLEAVETRLFIKGVLTTVQVRLDL